MHTLAMHQLVTTNQEAHRAPVQPFTIEQAHMIMQFHVACRAARCPRKAAAVDVLVDGGRMVLSPIRPR
ncbi:hypothetical protein [Nocardia aurea]|uniref:Uncharacterized protein n=1 Tax=Nocardia aurea TaxID=2144174 RepID=A0ABV3FY89_9NOCA